MPAPHLPTDPAHLDPAAVTTAVEFGAALRRLRLAAGRSLRDLEKQAASGPGRLPLVKSTVADIEHGKRLPRQDWLVGYLTACNLPKRAQRPWLELRTQLAVKSALTAPGPPRWQRVVDCDPRALGVHPSITSIPTPAKWPVQSGTPLPTLPLWVSRDVEDRVCDAILAAAGQGGLVVLLGGASTGKTRLAYQALLAKLPDWRLYQPADTTELAAAVAGRQLPRSGCVVWLDEFHDYLAGDLALATMRALLDRDRPTVLLATMGPEWHKQFTVPPPPPPSGPRSAAPANARDPVRDARKILTTIPAVDAIIWVDDFSKAERQRARHLAGQDPRLAVALDDPDFGPTQVLAAAPQLVDHWEHASDPYGKALLTAAIDARRLGHLGPLPARLLEAAAPDYLTKRQRATAEPATWFAEALAYATTLLQGATAALLPVAGPGIGPIGYAPAAYLLQHGRARRRWSPPPASLWDAAVEHAASVADRVRLADEAFARCLYRYAVLLLAPAAVAGDIGAMRELARYLQDALHDEAAEGWWRRAAETGDPDAMSGLAALLMEARRDKEAMGWLRRAVETGSLDAMRELAWRLQRAGHKEAETWWRRAAEAGEPVAMRELGQWLTEAERGEEAAGWYRQAAEAGDPFSMQYLAEWLEQAGRGQEAERWYLRAAESGNPLRMLDLVLRLERAGRSEEAAGWVRRITESQLSPVLREVARWLEQEQAGQGEDAETWSRRLADPERTRALAWWFQKAGRGEDAERLYQLAARSGDPDAMRDLARWLEETGRGEEAAGWWRQASEAGDPDAMQALARWLERIGRGEEAERWWRQAAEAGRFDAMVDLTQWLERVGRGEEADQLQRFGLQPGGSTSDAWDPPASGTH